MVFCDIASFFSPRGGGVATYHRAKQNYFARHPAHRYVMIVPARRDSVEAAPGGAIYRLRGFRFDDNYRHLWDPLSLRRVLRDIRPDVLEFGSPYLDYWAASAAARGLGAVRTAFYHADFPDTYVRPLMRRSLPPAEGPVLDLLYRYVRRVFGRLDATLAASRFIAGKLGAIGLNNVFRLPFGVDMDAFRPSRRVDSFRAGLGVGPNDKLLLFAGRYRADKGIDVLLAALPSVLDDHGVHVAFAGTGPLQDRVKVWAARSDRVHDLGFIGSPARMAQVYASSDGLLSPGGSETFGFAVCEAVASGSPVVSADSGGGAEMVDRLRCGRLFKAGQPADLARAVSDLIREDFVERIASARDTLRAEFNWDRTFETYVDHHGSLR